MLSSALLRVEGEQVLRGLVAGSDPSAGRWHCVLKGAHFLHLWGESSCLLPTLQLLLQPGAFPGQLRRSGLLPVT